jgi:hypothetical protein
MVAAVAFVALATPPRFMVVHLSGTLQKANPFTNPGNGVAMFELVQYANSKHELGKETYLGRCDRKISMSTGRDRFRLDMKVPTEYLGRRVSIRAFVLSRRVEKPFLADAQGLASHDDEEVSLTLKRDNSHINLRVSLAHPLPGG